MKKRWETGGRSLDRRAEDHLKSLKIPLRRRMDVMLFAGILVVFILLALVWGIGIIVGDRLGIFDPPPIRSIEDNRILTNIREEIDKKPLLDAVKHLGDGRLYIAQQGGTVHSYNPSTRLWKSEQPFLETDLLTPDVVMLRSGSGADPLSNHARDCPDPESLWGVSANSGLVRRINGRWQRVIGDSSFIGSQNKPVQKGQLTAAAVSSDGNWLVVGTKEEGIGVYHLESRQWVPLQRSVSNAFPSLSVTHITWWQNRFWVGGPSGLISMEIEEQTQIPRIFPEPSFKGRILDLDVDLKNRLWVLEERDCQGEGGNCLGLTRFLDLQHPGEKMVDERSIYPYLNTGDLHFAQYWGDRLLVAGKEGVFSYDPQFHSWERHFKGAVLSTLPLPDGKGFYFGYIGGVGVAAIDDYEPWRNPDKKSKCWQVSDAAARIKKCRFGRQNEVVGLAESGKVFAIAKNNDKARKVFEGGRTMFDPSTFRAAFGFGNTNTVLFIGDEGALVHDIVARTYKDIPSGLLPEWLRRSDWQRLQFLTSGDDTYAASPLGARTVIYQIPTSAMTAADFRAAVRLTAVPGPVDRLWNWGDQGVVVIAGGEGNKGRVFRFTPQKETLIGAGSNIPDMGTILDVAPYSKGLMAATSYGLWSYDYPSREWKKKYGLPFNTFPTEVANFNGQLLLVTANGKLLKLDGQGKYSELIGGERGFGIYDIELSDVMERNGKLYLAGSGKIYLYDPNVRQIVNQWHLPVKGEVTLKGFIREEPLALCANTATLGNKTIDVDAGPVLNLFMDTHSIWTVRIENGKKYLKRYPFDVQSLPTVECFFRRPGAGKGVTQILDAVPLPSKNELIAAATNMGVRFYSPEARSWYQNDPQTRIPKVDRIHKLNNHLVLTGKEGDNVGITFATLDSIQLPASTSTDSDTVTFKARPQNVRVKAFTINRKEQQLAFIDEEGAILEWKEGRKEEILPLPGKGPAPTQLRRVYDRPEDHKRNGNQGYLLFTTDNSILRYDLWKRFWQEIPLDGLPLEEIDTNIEREGTTEIVVAKTKSGTFFWGTFVSLDDPTKNTHLLMEPIFTPSTGFRSGDHLVDVQERGEALWTFVLDDRIKYYDPQKRQWEEDVFFPGATGSAGFVGFRAFYSVGNLGVLVENGGRTWWVAREEEYHPRAFARYRLQPAHTTALDTNGTVWRFTSEGQLFKYQRPFRGNYQERGTLYKAPFLIDPGNVRQAFKWKKRILFETEKGIRVLDEESSKEIPFTKGAENFFGIREVFIYKNQWWLRNADTILVLMQKQERFIETLRLPYKGEWPSDIFMAADKKKVKDQWPQLKKMVERLPNGKTAYDPIMRLFIGSNGELFAHRPGGDEHLANDAVVDIDTLPKPLDTGWLKWDRQQRHFEVKTPLGMKKTMSPSEFVQNQRLIFEEVDAILALGEKNIYAANPYGIWTHSQKDLSLTDDNITFQPLDWSSPISAAHGRFITSSGIYSETGQLLPHSQNKYRFTIGDVAFSEDINLGRVKARVKTEGKYIDAFASSGFTWDQNKRGIFYGKNNQLLVQSNAGYHPVEGYTGFSSKLNRQLLSPQQILSGEPEPSRRTLVDNAQWTWEKQNGGVTIRLKGKSYNFKPVIGQSGFGFTSDRLLDAVIYQNRLYVMTEAFLEVADSPTQLSSFKARRFPFKPTSRLKNIKDAVGRNDLILFSHEGNFYWDDRSQQFLKVIPGASYDPNRERLLARIPVNQPRLRFRRRWEGPIKKEVKVKNVSGKESWVSFQFTKNRFPFDVVTSINAVADKTRPYLYVGTNAGLQVYSGSLDKNAGLGQMDELYELRGRTTGSLEAVTKVGEPLSKPGLVIARSPTLSIESRGGTRFRRCTNPALLDQRLRIETDFWRFVDQKGRLDGRYKDENGNFSPERITIQQGRFPHDFLKDIVVFENRVFALWNNGWLTIHPTLSMEIKKGIINQDKQDTRPQRFIVIPQDISSDMPGQSAVPVSRGLYVEGQGWRWQRRIFQYHNGNWVEVTQPDVRTRILEYADNPPIVLRKHLVLSSGEFTFKRRSLDGEWLPLPWKDGRLAVDKWSDFFFLDNHLWAASPMGLTTFSRTPDGQIVLDPDHFIVIQEPGDKNNPSEITDIEVDQKSRVVTLRCEADSYQVYQGTLTDPVQSDRGIFKQLDNDPFVEKELVSKKESNVWEWHLKGNKDRNPGWLEGRFRGEAIRLIGGRFEFDTFNSLAFFQENQVEIGTDAGGWYQAAEGNLNAKNLKRPDVRLLRGGGEGGVGGIDFFTIKEVLLTREGDEQVLGLRTAAGDYIRLDRHGALRRTRGCPEFLGDDGFWRYEKTEGALVITAFRSKEGKAIRSIQDGRFTDDIVQGLPVTAVDVEGIYYLIPTQAGVLGFDKNLRPREIHAKPFPGLPPDTVPEILFMLTPGTPLYAAPDGLRFLKGSRGVFPDLKIRVPEGAVLTAVENGPQDFVRARWKMKEKGSRGWTLFTLGKFQAAWENTIYVNVNGFDKYIKNRETWGYPEPWIQIRLKPHQMEALRLGSSESVTLDFLNPVDLLTPIVKDKTLFLIGKKNLLEINLEHAMVKSFGGAAKKLDVGVRNPAK